MTQSNDFDTSHQVFVARQPIYDRAMELVGYELLYRRADVDHAEIDDGDQASAAVISGAFLHIGIDALVGSALAFINAPRRFIVDPALSPFFEGQLVIEVLSDVEPDVEVLAGLQRLKLMGHRIALDDFSYHPDREPLLALADYVKLDVLRHSPERLQAELERLRGFTGQLIAEKVETAQLHERCQALGFDLFQGYFYCRPKTVGQRSTGANAAVVLRLLELLADPDVDFAELEPVLAQDVELAYKLLRYVNSASFAQRREVESLREALALVGLRRLRDWTCLILMGRVAMNKPSELILTGLVRGRMCESLAARFRPEIQPQMFVVGLFSIIDALLDRDMLTLLDELCLSMPIKLALLDGEGAQGELLGRVVQYQMGDWDSLGEGGIPSEAYPSAYLEALQWTNETAGMLLDSGGPAQARLK